MPNHCEFDLRITGPLIVRNKFIEPLLPANSEGYIAGFLNHYYPLPKELEKLSSPITICETKEEAEQKQAEFTAELSEILKEDPNVPTTRFISKEEHGILLIKYGSTNWYDWALSNWGTKWGTYSCRLVKHTSRTTKITGITAWSPPNEYALTRVFEKFPDLRLLYEFFERGMEFSGKMTFKNGKMITASFNNSYRGPRGG